MKFIDESERKIFRTLSESAGSVRFSERLKVFLNARFADIIFPLAAGFLIVRYLFSFDLLPIQIASLRVVYNNFFYKQFTRLIYRVRPNYCYSYVYMYSYIRYALAVFFRFLPKKKTTP